MIRLTCEPKFGSPYVCSRFVLNAGFLVSVPALQSLKESVPGKDPPVIDQKEVVRSYLVMPEISFVLVKSFERGVFFFFGYKPHFDLGTTTEYQCFRGWDTSGLSISKNRVRCRQQIVV